MDPNCVYEVLCGHCDFPLVQEDEQCPRCQRLLEDCSACITVTYRKSLRAMPDPRTGGKVCSVCDVLRIPFGGAELSDIKGSFCTNLYGCPAGGLLLRTKELAVLPKDASLCPICRDVTLRPLDLRVFVHLTTHCLFCNNCLSVTPFLRHDGSNGSVGLLAGGRIQMPEHLNTQPCALCARDDRPVDTANPDVIRIPEKDAQGVRIEVSVSQYGRIVQLGRALIFAREERDAFELTFNAWFAPVVSRSAEDPISVGRVGELLLDGTLKHEVHRVLRKRLESLLSDWEQQLGEEGVSYNIGGGAPSEFDLTHSRSEPESYQSSYNPSLIHVPEQEPSAEMPYPAPIRNQVFISYSHQDKRWLDRLRKMLTPLERYRTLPVWADTEIKPGDKWEEGILKALASAKVAVFLVSSNFLDSDFIHRKELPMLLEAPKILWILISHCPYEVTPIGAYQAAHDPSQSLEEMPEALQNRVLSDFAKKILEAAS